MEAKCVIFDMDGVLFDTKSQHNLAFKMALTDLGLPDFEYKVIEGMRTDQAIRIILASFRKEVSEIEFINLVRKKQDLAYKLISEQANLIPNALKTLEIMSKIFTIGLASSASRRSVDLFVSKFGLDDFFQVIISGDDVSNAKPSPDIYFKAISELRVMPSKAVVVEDSMNGRLAAISAGIRTILYDPYNSYQDISPRINDLIDLTTIVKYENCS